MTQQFFSISVECCKRKSVLQDGSHLGDFLQEQHFKWSFSSVAQAFSDGNAEVESIEAYLAVLYMSCKCGDCGYSQDGLGDIVCSVLNGHVSLEQLSVFGKKHYIYLLSYVSVYEGIYVRQAIPRGLETLPQILQGPTADWYTHDMSILEWVFGDPILAGAAGQQVVEAFLDNTRLETFQAIFETEDCVECETMLKLCLNKTFLKCIVTSMASSTSDNVSKISLCLEAYIGSVRQRNSLSTSSQELEELCAVDHITSDQVEFLFNKTADVLQGVFLHHYSTSQDHNVGGLLQLLLLVMKASESMFSVGVKVLYHVLNLLSRTQDDRKELERTCMLTVLAAVTCTGESRNQAPVRAIVVQHEGFLGYLQQCVDKSKGDVMYCIGCDILGVLVQSKNIKCDGTVKMEIVKLLNSVCTEKGENQVASLNLLSALFSVNLASTVVSLVGRILPSMYRSLYIQLQQDCLQERVDIASSAVTCMRNLICYLHQFDKEMGKELLCQPWNRMLLDVTLELAASGNILDHHLTLLVLFTQFEDGCCLIKTSQGLLDKVIKVLQTASKDIQELCRMDYVTLMKQLLANFEDILTADDVKWLKENTDLLSETLERPELSTR